MYLLVLSFTSTQTLEEKHYCIPKNTPPPVYIIFHQSSDVLVGQKIIPPLPRVHLCMLAPNGHHVCYRCAGGTRN